MDGTNFIVPDRRPWHSASVEPMPAREFACRLAICAAVILPTLGLLVGFAAFGTVIPVLEVSAGP